MIPKFVDSNKRLTEIADSIRMRFCIHCQKHGSLVKHGFVWGPDYEQKKANISRIKARRFYCSNRGLRNGCGRTITVHLCNSIPHHRTLACTLWQWLLSVLTEENVHQAWHHFRLKFSLSTGYRLWHKAHNHLSYWRNQLAQVSEWSDIKGKTNFSFVINHFKASFPIDSLSACQQRFQQSIWVN
jgi:hypothetical protein